MTKDSKTRFNWLHLIIWIVAIQIIGGLSALFAGDIKNIYTHLSLPPLSPPNYLFGIVWPVLYALIAISGYLIYRSSYSKHDKTMNYSLFGIQLFLNFIWSIVFFNNLQYWIGVIIIVILDIIVLLCVTNFYKSSKLAAYLLIPYFIWILFATYLSIGVAVLN